MPDTKLKQGRKQSTVVQTKKRTQETCPKGRGRAERCNENGRTGYEKARPNVGKIERRSTARAARQVLVQRAPHSKKSGAEETKA